MFKSWTEKHHVNLLNVFEIDYNAIERFSDSQTIELHLLISGGMEVNSFVYICLILEGRFGDDS